MNQRADTDSDPSALATAVPTIIPTFTPPPTATPAAAATSTSAVQAVLPSATPQPTHTPPPTAIPTATPIDLPQAWLTPEPPPADSSSYRLTSWSPEMAEGLARLLERYYDEVMIYFYSTPTEGIYRAAFRYAGLAYREAHLRYPDDPRVPRWQLAEIAHRVASDDSHSSDLYLEALLEALQTGAADLSQEALTTWLDQYPLFFSIQIDHLPSLHGYTGSHIVTIASASEVGGASYWLLEKDGTFTGYPIYNNLGNYSAAYYHTRLADLTDNEILELMVDAQIHSGSMRGTSIAIYDLSQFPPTRLSFGPDSSWSINWAGYVLPDFEPIDGAILHIGSGHPGTCPYDFVSNFFWNGQWFEQAALTIDDRFMDYSSCLFQLNWAVDNDIWSDLERIAILEAYESKFGDTPPPTDHWFYRGREQSPAEFQQEIRYLLALNHALLGNVEETVGYLSLITEGEWLEPAQRFLAQYETAVDTYRACSAAGVKCDPRQALSRTAASLPPANGETILAQLVELGIPIVDSGLFDADRDRTPEYWFIVRHPGHEESELWLLAQSDTRVKPLFIDTFNDGTPTPRLRNHSGWTIASVYGSTPGYFLFSVGVTDEIYAFVRRLTDQEPYVIKLEGYEPWLPPTHPQAAVLDEAVDDLLANGDPAVAIERLLVLADMPEFEPTARYYYYLGLAYELAADETNAVINYWLAWQDCCVVWEFGGIEDELVTPNPFALMARAKLEPNGE
ncbi:MAG: hypothetical protein R6X32_21650 [Chloroflexota bacterium]